VVTIHDIFPITSRDYSTAEFQRRFSALLREAAARAGRVVTVSKYTADQLVQRCDVGRERIRVIPPGVDVPEETISQEARWRERQSLVGEGKEMLLTVGVLDVRKKVVNTLRALKFLPERYRLVLAGGKGYGSQAILDLICSERVESRVSLLGYVSADRLMVLYQAASALLFPSLEEGFGFPVLEAMACGLPVVTSQTCSLPEVGGDAALYVDPRDPRDIAAKVVSAVEDSYLRQELIQKGLVRARQFPWRRTAEETLNVYNEMLQ
jgi:glycosyltransferase involved in cell wall biosynthesis